MRMAASTTAMPSGWSAANAAIRLVLAPDHGGVNEGAEHFQPLGVGEDTRGEGAAVYGSVAGQNLAAEFLYHRFVSLTTGRQHGVPEFIGLDHQTSAAGQHLADKRFAAREAAGQTYSQHTPERRSAEATVLTISMAMVRGPDAARHRGVGAGAFHHVDADRRRPPGRCPSYRKLPAFRPNCGRCAPRARDR